MCGEQRRNSLGEQRRTLFETMWPCSAWLYEFESDACQICFEWLLKVPLHLNVFATINVNK